MARNSCGTSIYMIDNDYRLIYFNQTLREHFPDLKLGDRCYEMLCGEAKPCQNCPVFKEDSGVSMLYNKLRKKWLEIEAGQIDWPDRGGCNAVFVREIREPALWQREHKSGGRELSGGVDPMTGLYRRNVFFRVAPLFLAEAEPGQYCLMSVDIEHFKLFNDWYGQEAGDRVLGEIGTCLKRLQREGTGIAGYIGGDDFAVIIPNDVQKLQELQDRITSYVKAYDGNTGFLPNFGIYEIEDNSLSVSTMYDRAVIAMTSVKGNYARRTGYYDSRMKEKMEEDHHLLSEVQRALENHEFTFYAQPKCNMGTGRIVGFESLVRWIHPERGLIPPGKFLPLLESSGLITRLDLYIWEEVCSSLRRWLDQGRRAVPISVNVSRIDVYAVDVPAVFKRLMKTYDLDPSLVEIEITESAYTEESQAMTGVVENLRSAGFTVLMDDFGSGYSSLNMLRDVNVDVLKIDMRFLAMDIGSQGKGISILEAITRMANIMGMRMIAEGVETREQVDFLLNMGCTYGQGYYFYRPMPREEYERLLLDEENVDYRGIQARQMERIRLKELFHEDISSDAMLNNILGPVAFYDIHNGQMEILRVNDQYYTLMGTNAVDLEEHRQQVIDEIHQEDRGLILDVFSRAAGQPLKGAEGTVRRRRGDGSYMWLHLRAFFLREQDGHRLYYGAVSDVSEQKRREQLIMDSCLLAREHEAINFLNNHIPEDLILVRREADGYECEILAAGLADRLELSREAYMDILQQWWSLKSSAPEELRVLKQHLDRVWEEERGFREEICLRFENRRRSWIGVEACCIGRDEGERVYLLICSDITYIKKKEQELWLKDRKTESLLQVAGINGWEWDLGEDVLTVTAIVDPEVGSVFCDKDGNSLRKITDITKKVREWENFISGRRELLDFAEKLRQGVCESLYAELCFQGFHKISWLRTSGQVVCDEEGRPATVVGYCMDITEKKEQEQELLRMAETDALTGLYNRQSAISRIDQFLQENPCPRAAFIMLDLDNFKQANDVFGHAYGDQLLIQSGERLKRNFRSEDIVCRLGGDEFVVLCKNIGEEVLKSKLKQMVKEMSVTCRNEEQEIVFSVSAGYAMVPEQGSSFEELYHKADVALFAAKMSGKCLFRKYDPSMKTIRYELAKEKRKEI